MLFKWIYVAGNNSHRCGGFKMIFPQYTTCIEVFLTGVGLQYFFKNSKDEEVEVATSQKIR